MRHISDESRLAGQPGWPSAKMAGPRGARTPITMLAAAAALAGCGGGGGGGATQRSEPLGDSSNPLADLTVDAGTEIVPINLPAAYFAGGEGASNFGATLENGEALSAAGLRLDDENRIVGSIDDARTVAVLVTVDDGNGETFARRFTITAENPADSGGRPTVEASQLAGNRSAAVGEAIAAIDVARGFRDPDGEGDDLTYAVEFSRTGHGLMFDESTNEITGVFTGIEDVTAIVTVTNGGEGDSVEHRIIISANQMPTTGSAPLPQNMSAVAGLMIAPMDLASAFRDPEGTAMTFEVEMADGSDLADAGLMSRDGMIMGAPASAGVMRIRVTATDADGASSSREFTITVSEADSPTPGDDLLVNGIRNDVIDGGEGNDTVIYADARSNYRIWREPPSDGGVVRTIILDKTNSPGTDEGRDTLMNIETIRFGGRSGSDSPLTSLTFDTPAISVAPNAPTESAFALEQEFTPIEAGGWFEGGGARAYAIEVTGGTVNGLSVDPESGRITADPDAEGVFVITVTASDDPGEAVTYDDAAHSHTLTVEEPQRPPLLLAEAREEDNHVLGDPISPIDLRRWFADGQGDAIIFEVDGLDGTGLSVEGDRVIVGTPIKPGALVITIRASDPEGSGASTEHAYTLDVTTRPENALFALRDRTVQTDRPITPIAVDGAFRDPDGDEMTFSFEVGTQLETLGSIGLGYDGSTGLITGTIDDAGFHQITVEASDGNGGTHAQTFTVTAVEPISGQVNRNPEILIQRLGDTGDVNESRILPDGAVVFTKGREISPIDIRPLFNEPENDEISYEAWVGRLGVVDNPSDHGQWISLDQPMIGLSFENGVISGTLSEDYSPDQSGRRTEEAFEIVLRVEEIGIFTKTATFGLATDPARGSSVSDYNWGLSPSFVVHVNTAPVASTSSPLRNIPVKVGSAIRAVNIAEGFEDPDTGAALTFSVTGLDGTGLNFADNTISGIFTGFPGMATRKTVTITAADEHGIEATDEIELYLNSPPTVARDAPASVVVKSREDWPTIINFADFFRDDGAEFGQTLTYQALLLDADGEPNGMLSDIGLEMNPSTGVLSGILTRDPESFGVEVSARDEAGESVSIRVDFTENTRPDFDESVGFPEITLTIGEPIRTPIDLTAAFADDDGHDLEFIGFLGRLNEDDSLDELEVAIDISFLGLEFRDGMLSGTLMSDPGDSSGIAHDDDFEIILIAVDKFRDFAIDEELTDYNRPAVGDQEVFPSFAVTVNAMPKASGTPLRNMEFETNGMDITPIDAGGAFADDDGDNLAFSATGLGPLVIDRETGMITGTFSSPTILDVSVTAADGHSTFSQNFTITAFERVTGDDAGNELTGGPGVSIIEGLGGGDTLRGGGGDDRIYGHSATDNGPGEDMDKVVYSGAWNDYFIDGRFEDLGGTMVPWITLRDRNPDDGDEGVDTLVGIEALEFSDITFTVSANATAGDDILFGTEGIDGTSSGGAGGHDIIFGFGSGDDFGGGSGSDTLIGGEGDDALAADFSHHDRIFGGPGNDIIRGQGGGDTALYLGDVHDYRFEMGSGSTSLRVVDHTNGGLDGIDEGADTLDAVEWIEFGDGTPVATANFHFATEAGAARSLTGGADRDIFHVTGADFELTGNGGADIFQFLNSGDSTAAARTTILDFDPAEGDRILLQMISGLDGLLEIDVDTETESGYTLLTPPGSNFQLRVQGSHPDLLDHVIYIGDPARFAETANAAVRLLRKDELDAVDTENDARIGLDSEYGVMEEHHAWGGAAEMASDIEDWVSEFPIGAADEPTEQGTSDLGVVAEYEMDNATPWIEVAPEYVTNAFEAGVDYVFNN